MKITAVKINGLSNPMGYAMDHVRISWRITNAGSVRQKNSEVVIALDPQMERVVGSNSGILPCAGTQIDVELKPRTAYYVRVSVTGEDGEYAQSEVAFFETGKMQEPWKAKWIGVKEDYKFHPVLTKAFSAGSRIKKARLYITGVGLYEAILNGRKVGDDFLAPFFNDYSYAIQVQTYDVTGQLDRDNRLAILLGNGWYKGRLGWEGNRSLYGRQFAAIAELYIEYEDGKSQLIATDESFMAYASDITYSDIYDGEGWNRTMSAKGQQPDSVEMINISEEKLVDRYSMPMHVMEEIPVRELIHTPAGETVLDFGQNFSGYAAFHTRGFAYGTKIILEHGEILQNGNFYHDNYRSAKTRITYLSDGREEWFSPHFTYMGFRYVKVSGWPGEPDPADFIGKVVYSEMERTGYLETGHKKVNQLLSNSLWGLKSNFLDMPTDCPQRDERLGWTGDAQVFAPTASFFMDTYAFYRKFLWDMRNDQVHHGGEVSNYLPNFKGEAGGSAAWADAAAFIPDILFEVYGDLELLREQYPLMQDWVDWVNRKDSERPGGPTYLFDFVFTFGDWLALDGETEQSVKGGTEDAYIAGVYYYASTCRAAKAAKLLGYEKDALKYEGLSEKIRDALLKKYFTPNGRLTQDTQTAYIIALHFGVWRDKSVLIKGVRERFRKDNNRIRGGFVGAPLTCETLAENGMFDLAMDIFLQEGFPSWLYCVNLGATTIWERWNSVLEDGSISGTGMNSLNHYAYGSVVNFVVRYVAGLTPLEPGYRKVKIAPCMDAGLGELKLRYISASGEYSVEWKVCGDECAAVHIEVPFDCEAVVRLPECEEKVLLTGIYDFNFRKEK